MKDGVRHESSKTSVPVAPAENNLQYTLRVDVSGEKTEHFVQSGGKWVPLDSVSGKDLAHGFGFYLPGNEALMVSGFAFTKKP